MKIVGITGGIGSGKSTLSKLFEVYGIPVYIADTGAKKQMNSSSEIKEKLIQKFGENIYSDRGLDRKELAVLIFNDPEAIAYVNSIVHPVVQSDFFQWTKIFPKPIVAIETAILFESGFDSFCDFIINVSTPLEIRIERVMQRDHLSEQQIRERIDNQISEEERIARSDFIMINNGLRALIPQVELFLNTIRS